MIQFDERYLVGEQGNRKAIVALISAWQQVHAALAELDDNRAYDEAKSKRSDPVACARAISEIKEGMHDEPRPAD